MNQRRLLAISLAMSAMAGLPAAAQQATAGQWQLGANLPFFPVHMHLIRTGELVIWPGDDGVSGNDPRLFDPVAGTVTPLAQPGYDVFCSGHSLLPDGRLFDAGGHISNNVGLASSTIYDPVANLWTKQANMNLGRWYPTDQVMPNGDVLVVSGDVDIATGENSLPQVWQSTSGTWRSLTSAQLSLGLYPTLSLAPNGQVFNSGPSPISRYLDTSGTGNWTTTINHIYQGTRDYDGMAMYQPGKLLVVGGDDPATATAEVIDLNAAQPAWRNTSPLHEARRQLNTTMLPDGKVLVTGGTGGPGFSDPDPTVATYAAEEWDPATEQWTLLASATVPRLYHSIAILLPDARVLTTGGNGYTQTEIFSPPYLFAGPRPTITSAPATVLNGQSLFVGTPDAANITSVAWIRAASVTHTVSMSQAFYNSSAITQAPGGINITSPNDPTMPAGFYLLFILNNGVPSVASMVHLGPPSNASPVPVATSLSPSSIPNGSSPTTITVNGSNFSTNSAVEVDGLTLRTSFLSTTQLTAVIPASYLATVGTQEISVMTPAPGGGTSASIALPITQAVIPDLTQTGTIIARILNPSGKSNPNPEVIRDGDMPPTTSIDDQRNYDTYSGGGPATEDWIGYQYATPQTFAQVIFQEGINFTDGGWFNTLTVQVLQNGTWVNVSNFSSTPVYPPNDGINYETYVLNFTPITGTAVRIDGAPGGTAYFTTVGELQVFGPAPGATALTSLAPAAATAGAGAFTLTVNGQGFAAGSVVQWNGSARATTSVSANQLTATILAADVATAGSAQVTVSSSSGVTSGLPFTINAAPALTSLAPASATAGGAAFTLTVNGQNFAANSVVQWNGSARATTFVSATQLTAAILSTDVAAAATVPVTVTSGGATTSALPFIVSAANAPPSIASLSPLSATAGDPPLLLTVNGTNFVAGSVIQWNGASLATTFVNVSQLTTKVAPSLLASAGTAQVTVLNPVASGGSSTASVFTIKAATIPNLTQVGTIIARITAPSGGGNKSLEVIRDGDMPPVGTQDSSRQYDTYSGGAPATDDWIGYQYSAAQTFSKVVFQEGINFSDGGWFNSITVQVLQNGAWVNVPGLTVTPAYPANDGISFETYTFTFPAITGNGIRVDGVPGGSSYFTSFGELQVYGVSSSAATLSSLAPASATAGAAAFTLTVNGQGFTSGSVVQWNGSARTTTFVSATQLTAAILATDVATAGSVPVTVTSSSGTTAALPFTINAATAITSLAPASATAGAAAFTLTVNGQGFTSGSVVQWNGSARTTTFVSATQLTAAILATDVAAAGSVPVTVTSSSGTTSALPFTINAATAITSLVPASATAGAAAFTLTVNGQGFKAGSVVQWNGSARTTTFVSATQLTAAILATDVAAAGSVPVTVTSSSGTTSALPFTINAANVTPPSIASLSPQSANAGDPPLLLTINGSNFVAGSVIEWNGASLTTTFVSASQLTTKLAASLLAAAGTAQVAVLNPVANGGSSTASVFTINAVSSPNLTQLGTIIARVLTPSGGGNKNPEIIRDGDIPPVGTQDSSRQYDTYSGGAVATEDWIGYQYSSTQTFAQVIFQEGMNFSDGGWFNTLTVQVHQNGAWVNVSNLTSTPVYPPNDGVSFESYALTFTPVTGDAIRIDGAPGGSAYFTSVGELQVYGPSTSASPTPPSISSLSPSSATAGDPPLLVTVSGSNFVPASVLQVNGASLSTTFVSPTQLTTRLPASTFASAGTAQVTVLNPVASGGSSTASVFTIKAATIPNLTQVGTIIARITAPSGGGNKSLEVIRDGDMPPVGTQDSSRQYDTYSGGAPATDDWIGYQYSAAQTFSKVVFQEGINFSDGGWFNSITVQVLQNGAWVNVPGLTVTPAYPANDGISFETYTFTFPAITGNGIRVDGVPGGSSYFTSFGELQVYGVSSSAATLSSLAPASATAGAAAFTLTVNGQGFTSGSVVQWNGSARTTTFVSATQLTAAILATDVATAGSVPVTVTSSSGTTAALPFTINAATAITSLAPASATAGAAAFTLTVNGQGFTSGSVVQWNGSARTTTFVSATQLTAAILATDVAAAGSVPVTVTSSSGTTSALPFTINAATAITSLVPASATAGAAAFTLTVNGQGFKAGSVVQWNGSARTTTFVSATQLTAAILATDVAAAGSVPVTVTSSSGTTSALPFTINAATAITSLAPASATAGAAAFTLTVNGQGFTSGSVVQWNGSARTTTFVSATQLTASILATDVAAAGSVPVTVTSSSGTTAALPFTITSNAPLNLTQTGTIIASVTAPTGGGNHNIQIIRDGDMPPVGSTDSSRQYDTYNGGAPSTDAWIGYQYATPQTFERILFQEGRNFPDGGFFTALNVQVRQSGTWVSVSGLAINPVYPLNNDGITYESYSLQFAPITGDAIRIDGPPGGSAYFISVGELQVFGPLPQSAAPTLSSMAPTTANNGDSPLKLTVTGTNFVSGSLVQWNGSNRPTTYVSATQLVATIPASDLAATGTANVSVSTPSTTPTVSGALTFTINKASPSELTQLGTIISSVTNPSGSGNYNLEVIRDGDLPAPGTKDPTRQFDSASGLAPTTGWIGYTYAGTQTFTKVIYQEGESFSDGGWFTTLSVQVLQSGTWVTIPSVSVNPVYTANDGIGFVTYTLTFASTTGTGIRIEGAPGGTAQFFSVGELQVFGP